MLDVAQRNQPWCVGVPFLAADATKAIRVSPGAGKALVITSIVISITTSAAQAIDLEGVGGAVEVIKLPASLPVGIYSFNLEVGIQLTANVGFSYIPAGAGPAGFIIAEGYVVSTTFNT